MRKKKFFFAKKIFFCEKNFSGGGPAHPVKKIFFWIHLDTPGNCQVLPDTPERPEKCPRVWFLGPGVSRSFQVGGNCEKKISGGAGYPWHNPTCTYACTCHFSVYKVSASTSSRKFSGLVQKNFSKLF